MAISRAPHLPAIFGREREVARGTRLVEEALAGQGSLLLISGEAGIGKTALAAALGARATARGATVQIGRCYDLTETPPYGPWAELFAQLPAHDSLPLPTVVSRGAPPPHGATSPAALFAEVLDYLAMVAATQPRVLVLDDLHWADPASLDLLHALARQLAPLPIVLIATYRDDELHAGHPLAQLLPALVRESQAARLDLRRLDAEAIGPLVAARYALSPADRDDLVRYLHDRTDGNPLFIGEMLRTLEDEAVLRRVDEGWIFRDVSRVRVPALLRHVIERRMERLGDAARSVLALAALIGQDVPLPLWRAVAAMKEEQLLLVVERAVAARVLEESATGIDVRFTHALIRQALYEGITPPRRRIWHRQVAEWLADAPAPDPDVIGYHFRQAGDARAADWLIRAGERAQHSFLWQAAIERFEAAALLMEGDAQRARARGWLLVRLAWLRRFSHPQEGIIALDDAVRIAHVAQDDALAAFASFYRGIVRYHRGELRQGVTEMIGGMDALDALADAAHPYGAVPPDILAYAGDPRGTLVGFLAGAGQYREALRVGERTTASALPGVEVSHGVGIAAAALGQPGVAAEAFARARREYQALGQYLSAGESAMDQLRWFTLPYHADQRVAREELAREAEEAWARARGALDGLPPRLARLSLLFLDGTWGEARTIATTARAIGIFRNMARSVLGPLARAQGDVELAWAVVHEDLPAGPESVPGDTYFPTALILLRLAAQLALDSGDHPTAHRWLDAHDRWIAWSGSVVGRAEGLLGWAAYYRETGNTPRATEVATAALTQATAPHQPLALLAAHRLRGGLAHDAGDTPTAIAHLDTALALAEACAAPFERAQTLVAYALTQGDADAMATLLAAEEIARTLGARPLLWQAYLQSGHRAYLRHRYADAERAYLSAQTIIAELAGQQENPHAGSRFHDTVMASIPQAYRLQAGKAGHGGLTAREREVVARIAGGSSNREIADALFIAEKTVEMHVSNSLSKLSFRSRAQLAAWAVARDADTPPSS